MNKYELFFGKEWAMVLNDILTSEVFKNISKELANQMQRGIELTPRMEDVFNAFKECPFIGLHSIILSMDVYSSKGIADGIGFSSRYAKECPKSLQIIYEAIDQDIYQGYNSTLTETNDLRKWANQGILLLNCGLTTRVGKSGANIQLWNPFIRNVIARICQEKDNLGVILMGSHAKATDPLFRVNKTFKLWSCEHPISASYQNRAWKYENVFKKLTEYQKQTNNIEIKW